MKNAIITTCKGRLPHLKQTLPLMLQQPDCTVYVVDYGCPDGTANWIMGNFQHFPNLKVVKVSGKTYPFNQGRARNIGARAAEHAEVLFFMDADILMPPGITGETLRLMEQSQADYCMYVHGPQRTLAGQSAVKRNIWEASRGFDESWFEGYGMEDIDWYWRLEKAGYVRVDYPNHGLSHLDHSDSERVEFYDDKDTKHSAAKNYRRIRSKRRGSVNPNGFGG